jgi:multiple sugar transport system permease protein
MSDTTIANTISQTDSSTWNKGWLRNLENPKFLQHLLLVPVLIFFIVWNVIPLFWLVGMSFYKYVLVTGEPLKFVGLHNFLEIFNSFEIWHALSNTFLFVILGAGTQTFLGIILGFIFWGSKDLPGRRIALTLIFTPMIMAPLATGSFFKIIYDPVFGILNYCIKGVSGVTIDFLGSADWSFRAVLQDDTWTSAPRSRGAATRKIYPDAGHTFANHRFLQVHGYHLYHDQRRARQRHRTDRHHLISSGV